MVSVVQTRQEAILRIQEHGQEIRALGVERLGLFGSFARDEQRPESDVDVLVRFHPEKKSFDNFMELAQLLEDVLQRRVELVTTEALSPYLKSQITRDVQYIISVDGIGD